MVRKISQLDGSSPGTSNHRLRRCQWKTASAILVLCCGAATTAHAQTFTTLAYFSQDLGFVPLHMSLVQGIDGNFYGTTSEGGGNGGTPYEYGTVFTITPSGSLSDVFRFDLTDGGQPEAGLLLGTSGNLYGTTTVGGGGFGTIFELAPGGKLKTLFTLENAEGTIPLDPLIQAANGNFYGTASDGGANNVGDLFEITPAGVFTILHSFATTDGAIPEGSLTQATDGNFYGTTQGGGANSCSNGLGCGTIFRITPHGTLTTLHNFCSQSACADGEYPSAGLVQATDLNLYGTTSGGGAGNYGTVFRISLGGAFTTAQLPLL